MKRGPKIELTLSGLLAVSLGGGSATSLISGNQTANIVWSNTAGSGTWTAAGVQATKNSDAGNWSGVLYPNAAQTSNANITVTFICPLGLTTGVGLWSGNPPGSTPTYTGTYYSFQPYGTNLWYVAEDNGLNPVGPIARTAGMVYKISRVADTIYYYVDNVLVYTSLISAAGKTLVPYVTGPDTGLHTTGATVLIG